MAQAGSAFIFDDDAKAHYTGDDQVAQVSPASTPDELFATLQSSLGLPDYFGQNWDALLDVLSDFSWTDKKRVVLVHPDWPEELGQKNLQTYLNVLREAIDRLNSRDGGDKLVAIFPASAKEKYDSLNRAKDFRPRPKS